MLFVICSTKGGVGKSAFAMHVIAPYVKGRFGQAALIEIDDYNFDSDDYSKSGIGTETMPLHKGASRIVERLLERSMLGENIVLDIGGNKTCGEMLGAIGDSALRSRIDAFLIPVSQTGKDVQNARKTVELIDAAMPGRSAHMFLGVTRLKADADVSDVEYYMPDAIEMSEQVQMSDMFVLPDNLAIPSSRMLGQSVWELATIADAYVDDLDTEIAQHNRKNGPVDLVAVRSLNRRVQCVENAKRLKPHLESIFNVLDSYFVTPSKVPESSASN